MEKKEPIKISLPMFITVIVLLVACISGVYMFMQNQKLDKEIANLREQISKTQTEKNELQEKLDLSSNAINIGETNSKESNSSENQFDIYQENFRKTYKSVIEKDKYETDQFVSIPSGGSIRVEKNGDAYYGENQKIDTNVASAHFSETGQEGYDIILIHRDGTASKINWLDIKNEKYQVTKIEKAKDIVNVISILEHDDIDGGTVYYLVDINGNIIDVN